MRYYIYSSILGVIIAGANSYFEWAIIDQACRNMFIILLTLLAFTMPAIGSLSFKILELKKDFPQISTTALEEIKKCLYEQIILVFASVFISVGYETARLHFPPSHCLTAFFVFLLSASLFFSVFNVFDVFKSFIDASIAVANKLDKDYQG